MNILSGSSSLLREINLLSIFIRLTMATVFGGIIGLERASKRRAAGFRTYMLVCVGSTLVMLTNQYISTYFTPSDPARLGAQVISGIGFLGAGTIIVTRHNQVIGLTTAAGLWASACIGVAIGIGFYEGALLASVFILFIIIVMHRIDRVIIAKSKSVELYIELKDDGKLSDLLTYIREQSIIVHQIEFTRPKYEQHQQLAVLLSLQLPKHQFHFEVIESISKVDVVEFVEEM